MDFPENLKGFPIFEALLWEVSLQNSNRNSLFLPSQEIHDYNSQDRNMNGKVYHLKDFLMQYSRSYKVYIYVLKNKNKQTNHTDQAKIARQTKSQRSLGLPAHCHSNVPCSFITLCLALAHLSSHVFILIKKTCIWALIVIIPQFIGEKPSLEIIAKVAFYNSTPFLLTPNSIDFLLDLTVIWMEEKERRREGETLSHTRNKWLPAKSMATYHNTQLDGDAGWGASYPDTQ